MIKEEKKRNNDLLDLKDLCSEEDRKIVEERVEDYAREVRKCVIDGYERVALIHGRVVSYLFSRLKSQ